MPKNKYPFSAPKARRKVKGRGKQVQSQLDVALGRKKKAAAKKKRAKKKL